MKADTDELLAKIAMAINNVKATVLYFRVLYDTIEIVVRDKNARSGEAVFTFDCSNKVDLNVVREYLTF